MAIFKGAGVAIVTPMYDNEEVNYDKLEELINMQIMAQMLLSLPAPQARAHVCQWRSMQRL